MAQLNKIWTVLELVTWSSAHLQEKKIDEARLTVELLLGHVLKMTRIQLYMNFDKPLTPQELASFKIVLKRRLTREPLQYIVGETQFMGFQFNVDTRVLIPRPETETLVEEAVRCCKRLRDDGAVSVLDVGTGSGCIAVSCARLLPASSVYAIDISRDALSLAVLNAERNNVTIQFMEADILSAHAHVFARKFDAIISNPPYISSVVYPTLQPEITNFEPRAAETDERDGLSFYRRLAELGSTMLEDNGFLAVEHACDQQDDVTAIFVNAGWCSVVRFNDLGGNPRCVIAREPKR